MSHRRPLYVLGDLTEAENAIGDALAGNLTEEQQEALAEVEEEYAELLAKEEVSQKEIDDLLAKIDEILNPEPEKPAIDKCTCTCHNDDLLNRIVFKIVQFIRRLFGINSSCSCGTVHTEGLTPIWKIITRLNELGELIEKD